MNSIALWMLMTAAGAPQVAPNTTMYYVTADWCGYCHEMKPTIERLKAEGYPIQVVDRDRNQQLAMQLGVQGVPSFVVVQNQQAVDRLEGRTSYARLVKMFPRAVNKPKEIYRGQSPDVPSPTANTLTPTSHSPRTRMSAEQAKQLAMQASVKLKVSDPQGYSYGSGTIIHMHHGEALVLTCGHIFRDSQGSGEIEVTMFAPGSNSPVVGKMISYDLDRDVALVSIRPNTQVKAVSLAGKTVSAEVGQPAFSIGCNQGQPASVMDSRINSINRYQGPDNLQAAGTPIDGRSGGGLFAMDGSLIGVCNAADPQDQEGYYAALPTIYVELNKMKIAHLFEAKPAVQLASTTPPRQLPNMANNPATRMPSPVTPNPTNLTAAEIELLSYLRDNGQDTEVLLLLKSKSNPAAKPAVFTLPTAPSPQFMQQILVSQQRAAAPQTGVTLRGQSQ